MSNINTGNEPAAQWSMTLGAFGLPGVMLPGGSLHASAAVSGGTCAVATRRYRPDAIFGVIPSAALAAKHLGQPTVIKQEAHNQYATSVDVDGVGASGPPRERETA
ncbi:MAG TPA: hypothetical protein VN969_18725 [Streptosporangiaceae bacterium]|nr:hypothetical protein [Streptosporangiaceae bacterium]